MPMRSEDEWLELKEFILFCKEQKVPRFKLDGFECELPAKDINEAKLDALRYDIDALKSITNRLILALESKPTDPSKPFTNRINLAAKNA